ARLHVKNKQIKYVCVYICCCYKADYNSNGYISSTFTSI
uniref:Uncharacterized protein n=1 Tax=Macaca fascicularis TaxID=9541 RepID=A0A7N9D1A0_MACFA